LIVRAPPAVTVDARANPSHLIARPPRTATRMTHDATELDVTDALREATVAAFVLDREARFRWLNRGAIALLGDRVGQRFTSVVVAQDLHAARMEFAKTLIAEATPAEYSLTLVDVGGGRVTVCINAVPFREGGEILGVFGIACPPSRPARAEPPEAHDVAELALTARQYEILALMADGLGTAAIAARVGISDETVRNHIRALFRELDVHSRLEAVVRAYRLGLLRPRRD